MRLKFLLILVVGIFLINNVLGFDWDNVVTEVGTDPQTELPTIEIKNAFGLGETLFEGAVTEHTPTCGQDCSSKLEFNHSGGVLIDDIKFLTDNNGEWIEQNVRSYKFKYEAELPQYETQCVDLPEVYSPENNTYYTPQSCSQVQNGTYTGFKNYYVGDELEAGHYELFLEAKKKPSRTVDWVIKVQGKWLDEWAVWGGTFIGTEYQLIIEADNISETDVEINDVQVFNLGNNLWKINTSNSNDEISRAKIMQTLFYDQKAKSPYFTNPTRVWSNDARDNGKRGHFASLSYTSGTGETYTGTFSETTNNLDVSSWSKIVHNGISFASWEIPSGTTRNSGTNNELGTDTSTDEVNNPSNCQLEFGAVDPGTYIQTIILSNGTISWSGTGGSYSNVDFYDDHSFPIIEYSEASVTLNSPTNNYISDTPSITYNATAEVTNGAYLTNMSLWTNLTGTWALNETIEVDGTSAFNWNTGNEVAYFDFNTTTGDAIDLTGNGNNGTVSVTARGVTGILENAFDFELTNTDGVNIGNDASLLPSEISISTWVKLESTSGYTEMEIVSRFGSNVEYVLGIDENAGSVYPFWKVGTTSGQNVITSGTAISAGTWYHIVGTWDSTTGGVLYVDNISKGTTNANPGNINSLGATETMIGALRASDYLLPFDGIIDEVFISNESLTHTNITRLYNNGSALSYNNDGATGSTSSTQTWTKTITDTTIWNVEACDTDGDCGFATSNYTVSLDATAPTISITSPTTPIEDAFVIGSSLNLNTTITDTNLDTCWFEYNNTNTTITGCLTGVLNSTAFTTVLGEQTITVYANDSVGNIASQDVSWTYNFIESGASYTAYAYETQSDTFELNFTTQISVQSISAELKYNGNSYTSTANCVGNDCTLSNTFDLPTITGSSENVTFYWEFTIFDGSSSNTYNSTSREQNVTAIDFVKCGSGSEALDFTAAREDTLAVINPFEFDGSFNYWLGGGSVKKDYSYSASGVANVDLCISVNETFYIDGTIEYDNSSGIYVPRTYLFSNYSINNVSQGITLLLLESTDSTTFIQEVLENRIGVPNAYIHTYRYYPGTNTWNITQITKTDVDGKTVGFYEAETATYKHEIILDGVTEVNETEGRKMIPETVPYTITWNLDTPVDVPWEVYDDELGLSKALTWNEDTMIVTFSYTGNASFSNGNLTVYEELYSDSDTLVCNSTNVLSVATITCNLTGEEGSFIAYAYVDKDGETLDVDRIRFKIHTGKDVLGIGGVLIAFFILLVAGCAFLVHPIIGIIAIDAAIILLNVIGIVSFGPLFTFGILAISGVLIWLLKD